ncbi:TIGR02391 family protein [Candidatus Saccharibacteria bacterium]|nr:TIGR02391 family protein [Candidatus Saccharibacteria bacterium]
MKNSIDIRYDLLDFFYKNNPSYVCTLDYKFEDRNMVAAEARYLEDKGLIEVIQRRMSGDVTARITADGIDCHDDASFSKNYSKYVSHNSIMEYEINQNIISVKINKALYGHIKRYLNTADYYHAVEESYKIVRKMLNDKLGSEKATEAFSKQNCNKVLGCKYEQGSINGDLYDAIKYLHMSVQFFRNVYSHQEAHDIEKNYALQSISLASLALDFLGDKK